MLDAWIIDDLRRREERPREQPYIQLPLHREPSPRRERDDDDDRDEEEPRGHVIVIDMV